jgi:hypothetical protein
MRHGFIWFTHSLVEIFPFRCNDFSQLCLIAWVRWAFLLATSAVPLRLARLFDDREDAMPKDRRMHGARDRARINASEDSEVAYWAKSLGVSKERLLEAIKKVGDSVQAVRTELSKGR